MRISHADDIVIEVLDTLDLMKVRETNVNYFPGSAFLGLAKLTKEFAKVHFTRNFQQKL